MKKRLMVLTLLLSLAVATVANAATPKYEYNFDGSIGGAQAVRREGDNDEGGNAGTLPTVDASDSVAYTDGVNGQALELDGTYGLVLDAEGVGETYTLAFWINPARFSNFGPIVQVGSDLLGANAAAKWLNITKTDWDGDIAPTIWSRNEVTEAWPWYATAYFTAGGGYMIERNTWSHIVVTVDGSKEAYDPVTEELIPDTVLSKLYVNGELIGEGPVASDTFVGDAKVYVGINPWDIILKGHIDDLKIYDVALSDSDVKDLVSGNAVVTESTTGSVPKTGEQSYAALLSLAALACGIGAIVLNKKRKTV